MPPLPKPGWLSDLVKMIQVSAPAAYTRSQDARLTDLIANHKLLRDIALQQNPAWKAGTDLPTAQQQFVVSSLNNAKLASKTTDPGARFVELPHPQGPDEALMGAASVQAPGYFKGTPAENAVYVETLGSTHPGVGRGILQTLADKYPYNPIYLQAMEEHGTPEFYARRGFQLIPPDVDTPLGNNGLPEYWLPRGVDLKAKGGLATLKKGGEWSAPITNPKSRPAPSVTNPGADDTPLAERAGSWLNNIKDFAVEAAKDPSTYASLSFKPLMLGANLLSSSSDVAAQKPTTPAGTIGTEVERRLQCEALQAQADKLKSSELQAQADKCWSDLNRDFPAKSYAQGGSVNQTPFHEQVGRALGIKPFHELLGEALNA